MSAEATADGDAVAGDGQRPCKSCARMGLSCDATQPNCSSGATPAQAAIPSVADFFQSPEERMIAMQVRLRAVLQLQADLRAVRLAC
eukprot:265460-Rhodomonas_salina.2